MISSLYIEVNVLCIAVLLIMMAKVKHGVVLEKKKISKSSFFNFGNFGPIFELFLLW